jgi:hypothetical protein
MRTNSNGSMMTMVFRSSVCPVSAIVAPSLCSPPTSQRTTMPLATHDGDRGSVEDKTTRPSWVGPDNDAEEDEDDENPTTTRIRRRRQTTTAMTRTIRLALAAVAVGSLRSFLADRRHRADGGGKSSGSSSGIIIIAVSSGPPVSDASRSSPSVSIQMEPPRSGKDDETAALNATSSSSASHVVTATAEEEYDDDEIGTSTSSSIATTISSSSSMCSCLHSFSNRTCCARTVLRAHKFGHVLAAEWFDGLRRSGHLDLTLTIEPATLPSSSSKSSNDYRHVVFVRNYVEAFVSGYLYHKTGRECWLDPDGYPNGKPLSRQFNLYWGAPVKIAQHRHSRFGVIPPRHNRSLCEYLADETEQDGMKVYVAVALDRWYSGLKEYLERTKMASIVPGSSSLGTRSYFVCLEDASDPRYQKDWYDAAMDHLYPGSAVDGGGRYAHPFPQRPVAKAKGNAHNQHAAYHGSHATSHDPDLRQRLTQLVSELDRDVFDGRVSAVDAMIGCAGSGAGRTAPKASLPRAPH